MCAMQLHTPALHPVQFTVAPPGRFTRQQLLVRFVAALALGLFGLTFATLFALAYCFLPAYAAARIALQQGGTDTTPTWSPRSWSVASTAAVQSRSVGVATVTTRPPSRSARCCQP